MAARLHLTIGEVLSLLREEFPDVSISKIRFLESQGLVDPERTPSGYRKFYEQDVERLRWILLQQKEHFLPLKVIRDRLDTDGSEDVAPPDEAAAVPLVAPAAAVAPPSALDTTPADSGPAAASAPAARPSPAVESPPAAPPVAPPPVAAPEPVATRLPAVTRPRPEPSRPAEREAVQPPPSGARARGGRSGGGGSPAVADRRTAAEQIRARDSDDGREGAVPEVWTATELAEALGSTLSLVRELEQYGIVRPAATVGGVGYFDGHGLALARIGCRLAELGVEPRHLRPWRNSADREVGLFEQLVLPLLRQRSDDARQDGADRLAELVALGGELRSGLVAEALRALG